MKAFITFIEIASLISILHKANGASASSASASGTSSASASGASSASASGASAEVCPYKRFSKNHSSCKPSNTSCNIIEVFPTPKEIQNILDKHNEIRNNIATGKESLSPAANMMQMEWDDELAAVAQKHAEQCVYTHDCPNCRRVDNFAVGQNIAQQLMWGTDQTPKPDWGFAIGFWYAEEKYATAAIISNFQAPSKEEYRHFTELVWAETFRLGCGYVVYRTGTSISDFVYYSFYVCNYGPAGNMYGTSVYKQGQPCSKCPENTSCGYGKYPGLCQRLNNKPPHTPVLAPYLLFCDFNEKNPHCSISISGSFGWTIMETLEGNYITILLQGGQSSTLAFWTQINPKSETFCATLKYRKGPYMDGEADNNNATEVFQLAGTTQIVSQLLPGYDENNKFQFSIFNMTLNINHATIFKIIFSVPPGAPPQFLDIKEVLVTEGMCNK